MEDLAGPLAEFRKSVIESSGGTAVKAAVGDSCSISAPGWEMNCRVEWEQVIAGMTCGVCGTQLSPSVGWDGIRPPRLQCKKSGCKDRYKVVIPTREKVA
jgi:hypothetical protein